MAGKTKAKGAKAPKTTGLLAKIKSAGFEVSEQKTKLWSEPEFIAEGLQSDSFESLRVSLEYEDSVFAIIREGDESTIVPFMRDELDVDDLVYDEDTGIIDADASNLSEDTFAIGVVTALRDDDDFSIEKGDTKLKLYVE